MMAHNFVRVFSNWASLFAVQNPLDGCDPEEYRTWTCCEEHMNLAEELTALRGLARGFGIDRELGIDVLSRLWFELLGERFAFALPDNMPQNWPGQRREDPIVYWV